MHHIIKGSWSIKLQLQIIILRMALWHQELALADPRTMLFDTISARHCNIHPLVGGSEDEHDDMLREMVQYEKSNLLWTIRALNAYNFINIWI